MIVQAIEKKQRILEEKKKPYTLQFWLLFLTVVKMTMIYFFFSTFLLGIFRPDKRIKVVFKVWNPIAFPMLRFQGNSIDFF